MDIKVNLPAIARLPQVQGWHNLSAAVDAALPAFADLADQAFEQDNYQAWVNVQEIFISLE